MWGTGGVEDGYAVGSKRQRMTESNPYFAVNSGASGFQPYAFYGSSFRSSGFPVVRLRSLPFNCTDIDILKFFAGFDTVDVLLVNRSGRFSGDAFVVFASTVQADLALQRNRQSMGPRFVEVVRCRKEEYYHAVAAEVNYEGAYHNEYRRSPPPAGRPRKDKHQLDYTEILKLRGLPFSVTKLDIIKFFGDFNLVEDKIHIARRPDGKITGEAYAEFTSADEAKRAMCKDKVTIGSRYIELFPASPDEVRRAEARGRQ